MGGKALKILGIETERKSTSEHLIIESTLIPVISDLFNTEVKGVKFYRNKESHGDLDLLVLNNGNLGDIDEKLSQFGPIHKNGNIYSFEFEKYQVDIIIQPIENWDSCSAFFDYDPCGNLIGKISHKFGLKFGFSGLVYPFRSFSGRLTQNIIISKDTEKIFKFLGLDYGKYTEGFNTVEEIFEWIINSKYFSGENFLMENLNHIDRKRNKKRKTYQQFIKYINDNGEDVPRFDFQDKENYIDIINDYFPEAKLKEQLEKIKKEDSNHKLVSDKFNGGIVMNITNLKNKELGKFIYDFKKYVENKFKTTFDEFIINSDENIEYHIKYFYDNFFCY